MQLSSHLISEFVKATKDTQASNDGATMYGTVVIQAGVTYVKLDGSDMLTPATSMTDVHSTERVMVLVKNHTATIMGNVSSPAARVGDVIDLKEAVASKITIGDISLGTTNYITNSRTMAGCKVYMEEPLTTAQGEILYSSSGDVLTSIVGQA